jgi:competence protein ComEA
VNINTADKDLLTQLPGIGPVTADIIIQYRKDNGQFNSIDELTKVKGIGNKTLEKLKPYLYKL